MKRENESPKTMNSVAHNVLHICDGRAFILKCNLGKRNLQPLKSRQTETNCTPIANVLLCPVLISGQSCFRMTSFNSSALFNVIKCPPFIIVEFGITCLNGKILSLEPCI